MAERSVLQDSLQAADEIEAVGAAEIDRLGPTRARSDAFQRIAEVLREFALLGEAVNGMTRRDDA